MNYKDFYKNFGVAEFKSISGKKNINILILSIIIFISLLAIGLGKSSTNYLKEKMDSPFIKFVNVTIPYGKSDIDIENFKKQDIKNKFIYSEVSPVFEEYITVKNLNNNYIDNAKVRQVEEESEFYNFLISNEKLIVSKNNIFSNDNLTCIVTEKFMEKLGYSYLNTPYILYEPYRSDNELLILPIKISAIVKELPNYTDILVGPKLFNVFKNSHSLELNSSSHQTYTKFFIPELKNLSPELKDLGYEISNEESISENGLIIIKNGVSNFEEEHDKLLSVYPKAIRLWDLNRGTLEKDVYKTAEIFSFSFNSLDSINKFQEYLMYDYQLKIDMNTIEAKENFNFFNKLSILLSSSLIIFSIIAIFIFITNIIVNHIEKNKQNLGTLKAFGLDNNVIILLYSLISLLLIVIAFSIAYLLSYLLGSISINFLTDLVNINTENSLVFENLPLYILIISFFIIPSIIIYYKLRSSLHKKTPGDLIYNR